MRLEYLRRWQWMLIGAFVGLVIGVMRYNYLSDPSNGAQSLSERPFEESLTAVEQAADGRKVPRFKNPTVYRAFGTCRGKDQMCYVVVGDYLDPIAVRRQGKAAYARYMFVWPVSEPYTPRLRTKLEDIAPPRTMGDRLASLCESLKLKAPDPPNSLLHFLRKVQANDAKSNSEFKFAFNYAWWQQARITVPAWIIGSFVAIGVIWPTIINLIVWGSFFRPKEEKGVSLWGVKSKPEEKKQAKAPSQEDMDQLTRMGRDLEAKLKGSGMAMTGPSASHGDSAAAQGQPVRQLTATAADAAPAVDDNKEEKHFEAKSDDFYPTERHIKPKKSD